MVLCVSSRTHPKNSTNVVKKGCSILKGRAQKGSINRQEKLGGRVQKPQKIYDFRRTRTWNGKISDFCVYRVEHTDAPHNVSQCTLKCVKRRHSNNSVFFCLFYFCRRYYNKYLVISLQIKSSLVLTAIYSINLELN